MSWGWGLGLLPLVPPCRRSAGPSELTSLATLVLAFPDPLQPQRPFPPPSGLDGSGRRLCWTRGSSSKTQ